MGQPVKGVVCLVVFWMIQNQEKLCFSGPENLKKNRQDFLGSKTLKLLPHSKECGLDLWT